MYKNIGNYKEILRDLFPYNLYFKSVCAEDEWHVIDPDALIEELYTLTDREYKVVRRRYELGETFEQVAKHLGVTRERIRQIEARAVRKLRNPLRRKKYEYRISPSECAAKLKDLDKLSNYILDWKTPESVSEALAEMNSKSVEIKDLDLSVRSFNCLNRAGFRTLGEIADAGEEKIMAVRNLGRRSFVEIEQVLHKYGLEMKKHVGGENDHKGECYRS